MLMLHEHKATSEDSSCLKFGGRCRLGCPKEETQRVHCGWAQAKARIKVPLRGQPKVTEEGEQTGACAKKKDAGPWAPVSPPAPPPVYQVEVVRRVRQASPWCPSFLMAEHGTSRVGGTWYVPDDVPSV